MKSNMWDTFTDKGLFADPSKIQAILNMPVPQNAPELYRFLGMLAYLGKFIPNLSSKTPELRKLWKLMYIGTRLKNIQKNSRNYNNC